MAWIQNSLHVHIPTPYGTGLWWGLSQKKWVWVQFPTPWWVLPEYWSGHGRPVVALCHCFSFAAPLTSLYQVSQLSSLCLKTCVPLPWSQWGSVSSGRENPVFWITWITQDRRTWRNTASEQPSCESAQLERSQAAGRAVLSQAEGSPRLHPVSDQPATKAQQKSTEAGQAQIYFLCFNLLASGSLEYRDFLIQSCIFISAV